MAYCKFCGIESDDPNVCQLCGRPLPPVPVKPAVPPPPAAAEDKLAVLEQKERELRRAFFIACGVLTAVSSLVILLYHPSYIVVTIASLFVVGILLRRYDVIPPFEDDWVIVAITFLLTLCFPAFFVCLGFVAYGLVFRESMNFTMIWLLGTFVVVLTVLQAAAILSLHLGLPEGIPADTLLKFMGTEALGFAGLALGWIVSGSN